MQSSYDVLSTADSFLRKKNPFCCRVDKISVKILIKPRNGQNSKRGDINKAGFRSDIHA